MSGIIQNLNPALRKVSFALKRIIYGFLYFIDSHFTWLSIILLVLAGTVLNFILSYIFRYSRYEYWKDRALVNSIMFGFFLIALKGVLQIII